MIFAMTISPRAGAAPCAHTWRCRPLPAHGLASACGPSIATPAEAPAVTCCPPNRKVSRSIACFQHGRLGPRIGLAEIPQQEARTRRRRAARPRRRRAPARQHLDDRLEHLVAGGVAKGVVDRLQTVDIEHDQRAGRAVALDVGDARGRARARSRAGWECRAGSRYRRRPAAPRSAARRRQLRREACGWSPCRASGACATLRRRALARFRRRLCGRLGLAFSWAFMVKACGYLKACRDSPRQDSAFPLPCHALPTSARTYNPAYVSGFSRRINQCPLPSPSSWEASPTGKPCGMRPRH